MNREEVFLNRIKASVQPIDEDAMRRAASRMDALLKPPGSLGRLEDLGILLAGVQGNEKPVIDSKLSLIYAADHGVAAEGVSLAHPDVTGTMVKAFCSGRAGINVLASRAKSEIRVFDIGVSSNYDAPESVHICRIRRGTGNIRIKEAMSRDEAVRAVETGIKTSQTAIRETGARLVGIGEMGVGNTTPAAALTSVFTGKEIESVTGSGTGLTSLEIKKQVIREALQLHQPNPDDIIGTLARIGGLDIAGMAGAVIGTAELGSLALIDGFISGVAALVAVKLAPNVRERMVFSHLSAEPGHGIIADMLGLLPILDLNLRLGEGTGAALAMPIVEAGAALLSEMGTMTSELVQLQLPKSR